MSLEQGQVKPSFKNETQLRSYCVSYLNLGTKLD